jgi:DNA-binding FrmR family transcriptional regulator
MEKYPSHTENTVALKRIEGQVRGVQKMLEERQYCVDILHQIHAVMAALARVEDAILKKHLEHCVTEAFQGRSAANKHAKLTELLELISRFRKV